MGEPLISDYAAEAEGGDRVDDVGLGTFVLAIALGVLCRVYLTNLFQLPHTVLKLVLGLLAGVLVQAVNLGDLGVMLLKVCTTYEFFTHLALTKFRTKTTIVGALVSFLNLLLIKHKCSRGRALYRSSVYLLSCLSCLWLPIVCCCVHSGLRSIQRCC
jgi:hypothetical protein